MATRELPGNAEMTVFRQAERGQIEWQRPVEYQHNPLLSPSYTLDLSDPQNPYLQLESYFVKPHETVQFSNQRDILLSARIPFDDFITNIITILGTESAGKTVPAEAKIARGLSQAMGDMNLTIDFSTFQEPAHCADLLASILLNSALSDGKVFGAKSVAEVVDYTGARKKKDGSKLFKTKIAKVDAAISRLSRSHSDKDIYAAHLALEDVFIDNEGTVDSDLLVETAMHLHARSLGLCNSHYHEYSVNDRIMAIQRPWDSMRKKKAESTLLFDYSNEKYYYTQSVELYAYELKTFELAKKNRIFFTGSYESGKVDAVEDTTIRDIRSEGRERVRENLIYGSHNDFKVRPSVKYLVAYIGDRRENQPVQFNMHMMDTEAEFIGPEGTLSKGEITIPSFNGRLTLKQLSSVRINNFIGELIAKNVGVNMDLNKRREKMWVSPGITIHNMSGTIHTTLSKISIDSWDNPTYANLDRSEIYIDERDNPLLANID